MLKINNNDGQAMVEFIIAIFAIVIIITSITEFIGLSSKRGEIYSELRGDVGKSAIERSLHDSPEITPGVMPQVESASAALERGFVHDNKSVSVGLSDAMKNWVFQGKVDSITVKDEVWFPSLSISVDSNTEEKK